MKIRKAEKSDLDLIYEWANDPVTRQQSFNSEPIPYEDHVRWFSNKLEDRDCLIYIFEENIKPEDSAGNNELTIPFGSLRLQRKETNSFIISYQVAPNMRGKGYGNAIIRSIEDIVRSYPEDFSKGEEKPQNGQQYETGILTFIAEVKNDSSFSIKIFEKNAFKSQKLDEKTIFSKTLGKLNFTMSRNAT